MGIVDHSHPEVAQEIKLVVSSYVRISLTSRNWGEWILKETGAYGFRFDAVKHISVGHDSCSQMPRLTNQRDFIGDFVRHIREHEGSSRPKAFCVGEFWKGMTTRPSTSRTQLTSRLR